MVVTRIDVQQRGPFNTGKSFGAAGPYEYLTGLVHFAIDPSASVNRAICDIDLAPTNDAGLVEFSSEFHLLKPVHPPVHGRLLVDSPNRGNMMALWMFNGAVRRTDGTPDVDPGNGYLMRNGYAVLSLAIQWDVPRSPERIRAHFPEALRNRRRIEGPAFMQWWGSNLTLQQLLSDAGHEPYPAASVEDSKAILTVRDHHDAPPQVIPRQDWQFARVVDGQPVSDPNYCYLAQGFQPGKVYELTYTAVGAPVIGLAFAGFRDAAAFLKWGKVEDGNLLAGALSHAYAWGHSMNGRWLREFLYWGFNRDEHRRVVYDGMLPHTGSSRRGEFNVRFGQPSSNYLRAPGSLYPFAFDATPDSVGDASSGLFDRSRADGSMPKVVHVNSGMEYWWSGASLAHTTVDAAQDVEPPADVRVYYLAGTQHSPGALPLTCVSAEGFVTQNPINVQDYRPAMRALLDALDRWVREDLEPPPSQVPRVADGSAVPREACLEKFGHLPGAVTPRHVPRRLRLEFSQNGDPCEVQYPPSEGGAYPLVVSAYDDDCNDVAGIRLPEVGVPLGTYAGWNVRHESMGGAGSMIFGAPLLGTTLPFARTAGDRKITGDPRLSIEERYASRADYLAQVRRYAVDLARCRFLLDEDIELCVEMAAARWDAFMNTGESSSND